MDADFKLKQKNRGLQDLALQDGLAYFSCRTDFSFNLQPGAGRTHGETIEAGWAAINGAALASREMSTHSRHKLLEDVMGGINWRKTTQLGVLVHLWFFKFLS